ncbi:MAG: hypothetical protein O2923_12390 [Verrucomicrobia bacterium]|nr:hypothetical protein [Verrucomicrobiota bacterium]MDA1088343.1 hypothetical protein [Verrucomicrobiota bacterium]
MSIPDREPVSKQRIHLIIAVVSCHFVVDCYGGVFPIFKYLGGVDLRVAGIIAAIAMFAGSLSHWSCAVVRAGS